MTFAPGTFVEKIHGRQLYIVVQQTGDYLVVRRTWDPRIAKPEPLRTSRFTTIHAGQFVLVKRIEECTAGDVLDMGTFVCIDPRAEGQGLNTCNVRLASGNHYSETAGAFVRVWEPK